MRGLFEDVEHNVERSIAIKKLRKLLGNSLAYRIDPNAPTAEERDEAKAELPAANAKKGLLGKQLEARRNAILEADAEYQRPSADYAETKYRVTDLELMANKYKITVGVSDSLLFTVRAQGDSWEQVIQELTKK